MISDTDQCNWDNFSDAEPLASFKDESEQEVEAIGLSEYSIEMKEELGKLFSAKFKSMEELRKKV
ncbi:hypothetical protein A0J61_06842 [Choanephora cucurbitarum]|uniref:Uncharacterized protein n=1 Tax=Choanephora cucurbitarum TaxID=101091 RepID=A0A1C7N913_9FUNG|nr:hypothetical protein A0J61_06842 [Choanephora cucurbitarum]